MCTKKNRGKVYSTPHSLLLPAILLLCICSIRCTTRANVPPDPVVTSLSGKHILFVYGGWEGHHPAAMRDLYVPWLEAQGADVRVSNTLDIYLDDSVMAETDLVIQVWALGAISSDQLNGLLTAVRNGTGFAGWHGGVIDAFRNQLDYHLMTGAQFLAHPGGIIPHTIHITDHGDPVTEGIGDFNVNTEQYYLLVDPNIHVLATTSFSGDHLPWIQGREMPVIWKHQYGAGRIFVTAIGHRMEDHTIPEFETTLRRGVIWAAR